MDEKYLDILACPVCGSRFSISRSEQGDDSICLSCIENKHTYPVRNGIPRFCAPGNYADSFGFQWKRFSKIQLDSYNGTSLSEERFQSSVGWTERELAGKWVLDAGCGAGRFAEIALKYKANLAAFDLSEAVEACKENLASQEALIAQASIYEMPFSPRSFDFVYSIGVLQHTPDPAKAIRSLCRMVKPGGQIGLCIYERNWKSYVGTLGFKEFLRPFISRLPRSKQMAIVETLVRIFLPAAMFCRPLGLPGKVIMRLLPIASAPIQSAPLRPEDFKIWVFLDTFDMYTPAYDQPQKFKTVTRILTEEGFENIQRHPHPGVSVTATRRS